MIAVLALTFSIFIAAATSLLKEPDFIKEIEKEAVDYTPDIAVPETLVIMTKSHMASGIINLYKTINCYKPMALFIVFFIIIASIVLFIFQFSQGGIVSETVTVFSLIVLLFVIFLFMISLYAYLFCLIINNIK